MYRAVVLLVPKGSGQIKRESIFLTTYNEKGLLLQCLLNFVLQKKSKALEEEACHWVSLCFGSKHPFAACTWVSPVHLSTAYKQKSIILQENSLFSCHHLQAAYTRQKKGEIQLLRVVSSYVKLFTLKSLANSSYT